MNLLAANLRARGYDKNLINKAIDKRNPIHRLVEVATFTKQTTSRLPKKSGSCDASVGGFRRLFDRGVAGKVRRGPHGEGDEGDEGFG